MKFLFIDDCFRHDRKYFGYGGFCIDGKHVRALADDITALKSDYEIPRNVELKWSPNRSHYLNTHFHGDRQQLNKDAISLLHKYKATTICSVHNLNECHGLRLYDWGIDRAKLWAAGYQFKFIAERFENPYLNLHNDNGIVIADQYGSRRGETAIIKEIDFAIAFGTKFQKFEKICMIPMTTLSVYCPPVQLADLVVGIVVCSLANSRYALDLFEKIALLLLKNPGLITPNYSTAVMGFGFKLFPVSFVRKGKELFDEMDSKYCITEDGIQRKNSLRALPI